MYIGACLNLEVEQPKQISGTCVVITVPFEESVNIKSTEEKSFPWKRLLFIQVVSYPQCWANWLFKVCYVGQANTKTQQSETRFPHTVLDMKDRSNGWNLYRLRSVDRWKWQLIHTPMKHSAAVCTGNIKMSPGTVTLRLCRTPLKEIHTFFSSHIQNNLPAIYWARRQFSIPEIPTKNLLTKEKVSFQLFWLIFALQSLKIE